MLSIAALAVGLALTGPAHAARTGGSVVRAAPGDDLARAIERAERSGAAAVELATGTYYLTAPLALPSGRPGRPLVLRAAPGARPVLSGGRVLTSLAWEPWHDGIVRARISGPAFDRLRIGETALVRARYPNRRADGGLFGGTAADSTSPERVARWHDPAGGVIHGLHPSRWGSIDQAIRGKQTDGTLDLARPTGMNRIEKPDPARRYVENILEELDDPGEWYADFRAGWLYLKPAAGIDPAKATFVASALETVIVIEGTAAKPAHDIALESLAIRDTRTTFAKTTEPLLRSDWTFHRGGAILIENAQGVTIADNDLHDLGGNAVVVSGHARGISIRGNHIRDIGASAIAFVGRPEAVRSPLFEYHQSQPLAAIDRTPGPRSDAYPADSDATDNLIHDIGRIEKQSAGVEIAMAARIAVIHNSIYRVPRAGINIGDGTWGGHRLIDNDVFATVLETGDHGAFNAWGRDRYWDPKRAEMNARVAAEPALPGLDAIEPILIFHNRFQCDHGWDIDLDDGASNYVIENNVLLSGGLKLREGFHRIARNNIILNSGLRPHVWFADSGDVVEHNIFMTGHGPINMRFWGARIDDNLFPDETALKRAQALSVDAHSRAGDPGFVDPAHGDYRVKPGSPALSIGFSPFPTDDFGVTSPRLRALAEHPAPPRLMAATDVAPGQTIELLGMTVKTVETLDEQSAAGLPDRDALLITAIAPGSPAAASGLVAGDAILAIAAANGNDRQPTASLADLMAGYRGLRWRGQAILTIFHDQAKAERTVMLP
ncbi:MAG: peptide-binding protein [Sphingomonas sp.]|nr:MAG: peptide-binding protein [Sphingomonas sp.]